MSTNDENATKAQCDTKLPVVCSYLTEGFLQDFTSDGELTPIDIVAEITGLTYDEIMSCSKIVRVPQQLHPTIEVLLKLAINSNNF